MHNYYQSDYFFFSVACDLHFTKNYLINLLFSAENRYKKITDKNLSSFSCSEFSIQKFVPIVIFID